MIERLLADPEIDAVDICVPNDLHHDIALAAAAAGKAIAFIPNEVGKALLYNERVTR